MLLALRRRVAESRRPSCWRWSVSVNCWLTGFFWCSGVVASGIRAVALWYYFALLDSSMMKRLTLLGRLEFILVPVASALVFVDFIQDGLVGVDNQEAIPLLPSTTTTTRGCSLRHIMRVIRQRRGGELIARYNRAGKRTTTRCGLISCGTGGTTV